MFTLTTTFADGYTGTERWDTLAMAMGVAADYASSTEEPVVDFVTIDTEHGERILTYNRPS